MHLRALFSPRLSMRSTRVLLPILLLLFAAQGLAQWHMLTERHAVCVAHGEIEECGEQGSGDLGCDAATSSAASLSSRVSGAGHGDDHCPVALALHQHAPAASGLTGSELVLDATPAPTLRALEHAVAQQPIFRLAPKQSPPIA